MKFLSKLGQIGVIFFMVTISTNAISATLETKVFNPQQKSIFPVSSVLITGPKEALLVDTQFQRNDAQSVVEMIKKSGKTLTTIYISHGDPDYYFGLDVVTAAFPKARVVSSFETHQHIKATMEAKKAYWGPVLKDHAPQSLILPDVLQGNSLMVDGELVKVMGLDGPDPKHTFIWIPSIKTVLGGVVVFNNMHVFLADTPTLESRQKWKQTLEMIEQLSPEKVIPGHMLGDDTMTIEAVKFTKQYIQDFDVAVESSTNAKETISKMKVNYPHLGGDDVLDLSAKVVKGEIPWG